MPLARVHVTRLAVRPATSSLFPISIDPSEQYSDHVDYRFAEVEKAASRADIVLFIGTSFSVGVTDLFLQLGMRRRIPMFSIDPSTGLERFAGLTQIVNRAEEVLSDLVQTLGIKGR